MKKLLATAVLLTAFALPAKAVDFAYNGVFTDHGTNGSLNYSGNFNVTNFSIGIPAPGFVEVDDLLTITRSNTDFFGPNAEQISATFNFYEPGAASGTVTGTGSEFTVFGLVANGLIDWTGPAMANFGPMFPGSSLLITLEDTPYNALSLHHGLKIDARFDVVGTFQAVPGPVVGALLPSMAAGFGLLGFSYFRRRRNGEAAA